MRPNRKFLVAMMIMLMAVIIMNACAGKNPPTIAPDLAVNGKTLLQAVDATQKAVADAEARGAITREQAIKSMNVFKKVWTSAETAANSLESLTTLTAGSAEAATVVEKIQAALDVVDSGLLEALVPIGDENTRAQVTKLAQSVSALISEINRQILTIKGR